MGLDDSGTLAALKAHRRELIDPKIAEHDGRIVKTTGDGLLLEFPSVVDAVRCAVDVQRGMAERNEGIAPEQRLDFRIGINVGDIIIDDEDIFGDGVNVAARLQTLAEPGGICVSRIVRDQVLDKLSFTFVDLGPKEVKNIARPVDVFRVELGSSAPVAPAAAARIAGASRRRRWSLPAAAALALAGVAVWIAFPALRGTAPVAAPPALSVAVLPFTAPGGTEDDVRLADSLTRELTASLGEWRFAAVAPYRSASAYTGKASDVHAVGRELNVRYLAEGEVHRAGGEVVVRAQIIDAGTGNQVWSERIASEVSRVAEDRPELVARLNLRLRDALVKVESRRVGAGTGRGASAVELVLRARNAQSTANDPLTGALEAGRIYDEAIRLNPYLATALVARVENLDNLIYMSRPSRADQDRMVSEMDDLSRRAVAVDDKYPAAWYARALTLYWQARLDDALEANAQYGRLDPTRAAPLTQRAWLMLDMGRGPEALTLINESLARPMSNAHEESYALGTRCAVQLRLGRYDEAIADCQKSVASVDWWFANAMLIAAYAQKGDLANATIVKERLSNWRRGYTIADERAYLVSDNPTYRQQTETHFLAGLRKAGVPER